MHPSSPARASAVGVFLLAVMLVLGLAAEAPGATGDRGVRVGLVDRDATTVRDTGRLRVRVRSPRARTVRLAVRVGRTWVVPARRVRLRAGRSRTVTLRLTERGRRTFRACRAQRVRLALGRGPTRRVMATRRLRAGRSCATAGPGDGRLRVLFSTDFTPGLSGPYPQSPYPSDVDDGIATAMALNSPALRVDAMAITYGNNEAEPSVAQARTMVHGVMGRRDVAIAQGATGPLAPAPPSGGVDPCVNDGVRLLARELREGPATVLALGPLTDIACLARADPAAAANITELLAQVGARPGEPYDLNGRPALFSLNVGVDPEAVRAVLASPALSGTTVTASPYHLAGKLLLDNGRIDRLGGDSPEGIWLREKATAFRAFWTAAFGDLGLRPWDQTLVHRLVAPADYRTREVGWRMVDCSDPTGRNANTDCAGHGPTQFVTRDGESQQLWLGDGPGQRTRPKLRILDEYADPAAETRFLDAVAALGR